MSEIVRLITLEELRLLKIMREMKPRERSLASLSKSLGGVSRQAVFMRLKRMEKLNIITKHRVAYRVAYYTINSRKVWRVCLGEKNGKP